MVYSVAFAGKGGTGKTTMAGLLVKYLVERGNTPVLAVDADANANLNEVLGLEVLETLGDAREEMKSMVEYDYVIVNDLLDQATEVLKSIIIAERSRNRRSLSGKPLNLID